MHPLLEFLEAHPVTIALLLALLPLVSGAVRRVVLRPFRAIAAYARIPGQILAEFGEFKTEIGGKVTAIEKQVSPNGGSSMVDSLRRLENGLGRVERGLGRAEAHHKQAFIVQPRPAMEMDGFGNALLVSSALGRLLRTDPGDLKGFSYLQYLDGDRVEDFREAFVRVASNEIPSTFGGFTARIYAPAADGQGRESRGEWEFRAAPVGPRFGGDVLYTATLHPVDDKAREIADKNRWLN